MKNTVKFLRIIALAALIGFSMTACDNGSGGGGGVVNVGSTNGRLTITGLSAYNGKYVVAYGEVGGDELIAADNISSNGTQTGGTISDGQVTLKVWKFTGETSLGNFTGSGQASFDVDIYNTKTITESNFETALYGSGTATGSFDNGTGAAIYR